MWEVGGRRKSLLAPALPKQKNQIPRKAQTKNRNEVAFCLIAHSLVFFAWQSPRDYPNKSAYLQQRIHHKRGMTYIHARV
jgi:hypothetical protein